MQGEGLDISHQLTRDDAYLRIQVDIGHLEGGNHGATTYRHRAGLLKRLAVEDNGEGGDTSLGGDGEDV